MITPAAVCGDSGRILGTEKQSRRSFDAWRRILGHLFSDLFETDSWGGGGSEPTFDRVGGLLEEDVEPRRLGLRETPAEMEGSRRRFSFRVAAIGSVAAWKACR